MRILISCLACLAVIGCGGPEVVGSTEDKKLVEAMQKAGGDPNKLDDATRKQIEAKVMDNPMSTANRSGGPGPMSGAPADYPMPGR
jgi:hypothetical protein